MGNMLQKATSFFFVIPVSYWKKNDILFLVTFFFFSPRYPLSGGLSFNEVSGMFVALEEWRMRKMERAKQRGLGKNATITLQ